MVRNILGDLKVVIVSFFIGILNTCLWLLHFFFFQNKVAKLVDRPLRILVIRTAGLGDFIITIPALTALRRKYPNARIALLTSSTTDKKQEAAVVAYTGNSGALPWLTFVVPSIVDEAFVFSGNNLRKLVSTLKPTIKAFDPDFSIILSDPSSRFMGQVKKLIFLKMIGSTKTVYGLRLRATRLFFLHAQNARGMFEHHIIGLLRSIAETPDGSVEPIRIIDFPLQLSTEAERWAEQLWLDQHLVGKRVIAISPGSIQPHKRWPLEKFIALAQRLSTLADVSIIVLGTEKDRGLGDILIGSLGSSALNLAGLTTISLAAAVLRRCAMIVGNDGGSMHLASAVSCRAVSIVPGIEFPDSIEPWGSRDLAVRHPISCAPCYCLTHCPKGHNRCMTDIQVETVFSNSLRALDISLH